MALFVILFALMIACEVPKFLAEGLWKDMVVFLVLILFGFGLGFAYMMEVPIPNPVKGIMWLTKLIN